MRVVIARVLERARLVPEGPRAEKGVRKGITFVPARGARVRQVAAPRVAVPESAGARAAAL